MEVTAESESWREWRREAEGLIWRVAVPEDKPQIERMWRVKERLLGVKYPLPDLFAPPVILALVAEDDRGWIVDGVFLECVADVTKLSGNPRGFRALTAIEHDLASFLGLRGFRRVTAAMPRRVSDKMESGLQDAKFQRQQLELWDRELY